MTWLFGMAVGLILLGLVVISRAKRLRHESGLPAGRLIYADSAEADWLPNANPLYSPTYHLIGKPDYLVETATGIIPVEVKSAKAPALPYLGHLLQLAAYCLLIEETTGQAPPHGLLKYADALYEVDFTPDLRRELLDTLAAMRDAYSAETVARNHRQAGKCLACGFFEQCEEALQGE
jgi:CRISPR-associated exonuclease Cas4